MISPTLYLHIGGEKTGTSSVQATLTQSSEALLRDHSILYPHDLPLHFREAHYPVATSFLPAAEVDFVPRALRLSHDQLGAELRKLADDSPRAIVLSDEHLSSRFFGQRIADWRAIITSALPGYQMKVIFFVRSQSTLLASAFSSHVSSLGVERTRAMDIPNDNHFYNHHFTATAWAEVFGKENIIIRNFHAGDTVAAFLSILGIEESDPAIVRGPDGNPSLSREQAEVLHAVNLAFGPPDFLEAATIERRQCLQLLLIEWLAAALLRRTPIASLLTAADIDQFRCIFGDSNDRLQAEFALDFNLNDFLGEAGTWSGENDASYSRELAHWTSMVRNDGSPRGRAAALLWLGILSHFSLTSVPLSDSLVRNPGQLRDVL